MHSRAVGFFGARGSGKSHLAKARARSHPRVVGFLPSPLDTLPNARTLHSLEDVRRAMISGYEHGFRIVWKAPRTIRDAKGVEINALPYALSALSKIVADLALAGRMRHEILLYADELAMAFPEEKLPLGARGFADLCAESRHYRVAILGAGQRVALVSNVFVGNLDEIYILRPSEDGDVDRAARLLGRSWRPKIEALRNKDHIHKDNTTGRVTYYIHNAR